MPLLLKVFPLQFLLVALLCNYLVWRILVPVKNEFKQIDLASARASAEAAKRLALHILFM